MKEADSAFLVESGLEPRAKLGFLGGWDGDGDEVAHRVIIV